MSSMLEQLWPVFLEETSEQLQTLESALDRHDRTGATPDIDALFREFHTLKSSFSMVDLQLLVAVAHAGEDVLHGLRQTETPVDKAIKSLLLETVDWLKEQLEQATPGNYPSASNDSLLARLAPYRPIEDEVHSDTSDNADVQAALDKPIAGTPQSEEALPKPAPKAASLLDEERESLSISTLRISSSKLDDLVTHVSSIAQQEAVLSQRINDNMLRATLTAAKHALARRDRQALVHTFNTFQLFRQQLLEAESALQSDVSHIQQAVLDLRVIPLSTVFNRLPRIVRKRAGDLGKPVQLVIDGGDISIDKGMIDEVTEPLVHILQNAIDHGIETADERKALEKPATATITIHAIEHSGVLQIDIRDDGRGMDFRQIRERVIQKGIARADDHNPSPEYWLAFLFTREYHQHTYDTEEENLSGLDRVRTRLTAIGGSMSLNSEHGLGTHITMRVPVTVAIQSVMLIQTGAQTLAIPIRNILEIVSTSHTQLQVEKGQSLFFLRGNPLPVFHINQLVPFDKPYHTDQPTQEKQYSSAQWTVDGQQRVELLILQHDIHSIALAVDAVLERQELFVRAVHPDIRHIPGVGAASLLGNGKVVIILDTENLFALARQKPHLLPAPIDGKVSTGCGQKSPVDNGTGT